MRLPRNVRIFRGQWDAVPFLSVLFLLMLFMALESRMAFVPGVSIDLPEGTSVPAHSGVTLMVAVDHVGQIYYDNQALGADTLLERLRSDVTRLNTPVTLVVQADKSVTNERLVELAGIAQQAGVADVLLATRRPPSASSVQTGP